MIKKRSIITVLGILFYVLGVNAQVGINTIEPKASLDVTAQTLDGTTAEGIIAPRLTLAQLDLKDAKYGADQTGALVYVTSISGGSSFAKTSDITSVGYYNFNGTKWVSIAAENVKSKFFYMPSFVLNTDAPYLTNKTVNLYNAYETQFSNIPSARRNPSSSLSIPVYSANELDYYVIGFDSDVLDIIGITDAGVLTYQVKAAATSITYINIVFVVK